MPIRLEVAALHPRLAAELGALAEALIEFHPSDRNLIISSLNAAYTIGYEHGLRTMNEIHTVSATPQSPLDERADPYNTPEAIESREGDPTRWAKCPRDFT